MNRFPEVMPILSAGRHRNPKQGACFMEFASYLAGERWSDRPACTHPLLAMLARDVNDLTSDEGRARLVHLIPRVVGLNSDDPIVTATIAMRAAAAAYPVASLDRQRALAAGMLNLLSTVTTPALRSIADRAFAQAPDGERWARRFLARGLVATPFGRRAANSIVNTATLGLALACVPDVDDRLVALLAVAIDDTERLVRGTPSPAPQLVPA
jgi:hypothetical protein